ncbi:uncharacterized protein LOC127847597 isoform X2 [Dreissena polymorpha]|uniref:uncharacterized protein LOC127847597 isoform X2 n=1 Tax=Dreissena polymorpha TaxID=45954 RepID=UPI002263B93F|nr:uncharacterized protein LOC127847597 isoform X2 [Dreissena polymorpha]
MFAKPASKKMSTPVNKQKVSAKPKAVSVKSGVKTTQHGKRSKSDSTKNGKAFKPAQRPDAGYSLYSTDSEDQVTLAFNEMETCEKILTHLKKPSTKSKGKSKVKRNETTSPPRPLNENPPVSTIVPGLSSMYGTPFPYGAAQLLRQVYGHDSATNPIFNSRLASSTPDPEKLAADTSACQLPNASESNIQQDVPERDISTVSSVPPSLNHLQNMAQMVEIYKQLELKKNQQIQEAVAKETLQKLNAMDIHIASADTRGNGSSNSRIPVPLLQQCALSEQKGSLGQHDLVSTNFLQSEALGREWSEKAPTTRELVSKNNRQLEAFGRESSDLLPQATRDSGGTARGSLGFTIPQRDSMFRPVMPSTGEDFIDTENPASTNSSLTAFQHYISGDSKEFLPPQNWVLNFKDLKEVANRQKSNVETVGQPESGTASVIERGERDSLRESVRSEKSDVLCEKTHGKSQQQEACSQYQIYKSKPDSVKHGQLVYSNKNIDHNLQCKTEESISGSSESKSDGSDATLGHNRGQMSLDEVPERDLPVERKKSPYKSSVQQTTKGNTFRMGAQQKNESQNLSALTSSTPKNQNISNNSGSSSLGGKIVFIPDDSQTPTVIGHVPAPPLQNQPISWPLMNVPQAASVLSSAVGQHGVSTSQLSAPSLQLGQASLEGASLGYHSSANAKAIAASDIGIRKLRYLLKELKECNRVIKDVEVNRLVGDLDDTVNSIPQLALTFNLQTEIDLAIQPLRSENSQLRRKVRMLNQQLKEKEGENEPKDINFEILHLQTSNESLQKVLREERDIKTRLAAEVQYLYQEIHKMKVDKSKLIASTSEKETEQLKVRQEITMEAQQVKHDLELLKKGHEGTLTQLEAIEKENHILQVTLRQRDEEIVRQQEIVETMKESISELLHELEQSRCEDRNWDHNQSYGLNRLLKIVEGDGQAGFTVRRGQQLAATKPLQRTPERRSRAAERRELDFDDSGATTSTARLTQEALADHNRHHLPVRAMTNGRQGPASESELDTLVDLQMKRDMGGAWNDRPGQRRTSSLSPVRLKNDQPGRDVRDLRGPGFPPMRSGAVALRDAGGNVGAERETYRPRPSRERIKRWESEEVKDGREELSPARGIRNRQPYNRGQMVGEYSPSRARAQQGYSSGGRATDGLQDGTEVSVEQSRYSVTDYFRKYHPQDTVTRPIETLVNKGLPPRGRYLNNRVAEFYTSSEADDRTAKSSEATGVVRNAQRLAKFRGRSADHTISAIHDDDNVSSVSMSSVTTANTVDEGKFRQGIATLDANIARLQQALLKTKSMLS